MHRTIPTAAVPVLCLLATLGAPASPPLAATPAPETAYADWPDLRGPYLGQPPPGPVARPLAEGIVNPPSGFHSSILFGADGREAYWTAMGGVTWCSRRVDGRWSRPEPLPFGDGFGVREPFLTDGGRRLHFLSRRPLPDDPVERERIWSVSRAAKGWTEPRPIDAVVGAHPTHWQFSFSAAGDLYFTSEVAGTGGGQDVYVAPWRDGGYDEPHGVGPGVNTDRREFCPFVAPDGSYLLFARSVPAQRGRSDLFASFPAPEGGWLPAVDLGPAVNTAHNEVSPLVTPDGRFLVFLRLSKETNQVHWIEADVIDRLRPAASVERTPTGVR